MTEAIGGQDDCGRAIWRVLAVRWPVVTNVPAMRGASELLMEW